MKIVGNCPSGHIITRNIKHPEEWLISQPIKVWCEGCHGLVGVIFRQEISK